MRLAHATVVRTGMQTRIRFHASILISTILSACFAPKMAPTADPQAQTRAATAQAMGYPTRKSPAELDAAVAQQTAGFAPASSTSRGALDRAVTYTFDGIEGTCYTVVLRLTAGAAWGPSAEAGVRVAFETPATTGTAGPGLIGPGIVGAVGCTEASGPITLSIVPMVGDPPLGSGEYEIELWSCVATEEQRAALAADKQREASDQSKREEAERKEAKVTKGCNVCSLRYQGCIGARHSKQRCEADYRTCAFDEAGEGYMTACPRPL
jgi:hypothetical protein